MTLKPQVSEELEFIQIQKSKHARYIDGVKIVDYTAIAGDYAAPGCAMGKITASGKYGPVTRGAIDSATAATNTFALTAEADNWNFQVGDTLEVLDANGDVIEADVADDLEITSIDGVSVVVTNIETTTYADGAYIQKADGSSTAEFVCLELVDVSDDEDQLVGGMLHGAVFSDRMPNYDSLVATDIPLISFE